MKFWRTLLASLAIFPGLVCSAEVPLTPVIKMTVNNVQVVDGVVEAINQSTVKSLVNAKVTAIYADVDDYVAANSLLLELDDTQIKASYNQALAGVKIAQAALKQASTDLKRLTELKQSSYVSDSDLSTAQANADKARGQLQLYQAQMAESKERLSHTKIIAPYSGVVVARHIEVGETALVGTALLTGLAVNQNRIVVHIPQRLIHYVEASNEILVQDMNQSWISLTAPVIAPIADKLSHTVMVRAMVDKSMLNVRPGSFVKVGVNSGEKTIIAVPKSAVVQQGDLVGVFVSMNGKFNLRQIRTGDTFNDKLEVLSGLLANEKVATQGLQVLALQSQLATQNQ